MDRGGARAQPFISSSFVVYCNKHYPKLEQNQKDRRRQDMTVVIVIYDNGRATTHVWVYSLLVLLLLQFAMPSRNISSSHTRGTKKGLLLLVKHVEKQNVSSNGAFCWTLHFLASPHFLSSTFCARNNKQKEQNVRDSLPTFYGTRKQVNGHITYATFILLRYFAVFWRHEGTCSESNASFDSLVLFVFFDLFVAFDSFVLFVFFVPFVSFFSFGRWSYCCCCRRATTTRLKAPFFNDAGSP